LPRLDGRHDWQELAAAQGVAPLLELLDGFGLLERHMPPPPWAGAAQLTWLGHAAALYEADGRRILVDPLFHRASLPARPGADQPPDWRALGPLDAVLITHGDNDHFNPSSLLRLPRQTPIYIPRAERRWAYQVDLEAVLALLGFANVVALDEWQRVQLGDVLIVAAPFVGEDWGLELPKRTYLLSGPSLTVYLSADSGFMPEVYRRLGAEFAIDLALLGVSGCAEAHVMPADFGYGGFYRPWIPPEKVNEWIELSSGPAKATQAAALLGARRAFGYAVGGTSYVTMAYSDRGTHAELAALLDGSATRPLAMPLGVPVRLR
jgi:L-ascorbate metabolism protein UlaG (beta-lactamase superfamily)